MVNQIFCGMLLVDLIVEPVICQFTPIHDSPWFLISPLLFFLKCKCDTSSRTWLLVIIWVIFIGAFIGWLALIQAHQQLEESKIKYGHLREIYIYINYLVAN